MSTRRSTASLSQLSQEKRAVYRSPIDELENAGWIGDQASKERYLAQYNPCDNGLHVCGFREDGEFGQHVTEANFPGVGREMFDTLKAEFADDDFDLLIDLMNGGDIVDDFGIKRQMLELMRRKLAK